MALVAYDYGSDSEEGEDSESESQQLSEKIYSKEGVPNGTSSDAIKSYENPGSISASNISDDDEPIPLSNESVSNMFAKLPQKKDVQIESGTTGFDDVVEDFIPKAEVHNKQKSKVKIYIPSLTEFEDIDGNEPTAKKFKGNAKGTGLLSLLPPVKCVPLSNKSFIPNVLTQKSKTDAQVKKPNQSLVPNSVRIKKTEAAMRKKNLESKSKDNESDDSDVDMPETYDEDLWQKVCGKKVVKQIIVEEEPSVDKPIIDPAPEAVAPYQGLDNAAFKELVGKNSRMPRNIKLIDINEDDLVAEKNLWMTKSLTDPEYIPKPSEDDDSLDPTKKKKHHITYLAQKAKANELELQKQWSTSKHNRLQSRAKYGF